MYTSTQTNVKKISNPQEKNYNPPSLSSQNKLQKIVIYKQVQPKNVKIKKNTNQKVLSDRKFDQT